MKHQSLKMRKQRFISRTGSSSENTAAIFGSHPQGHEPSTWAIALGGLTTPARIRLIFRRKSFRGKIKINKSKHDWLLGDSFF